MRGRLDPTTGESCLGQRACFLVISEKRLVGSFGKNDRRQFTMSQPLSLFKYIDFQQIVYLQVINRKLPLPLCGNQAVLQISITLARTIARFLKAFVVYIGRAAKHTTCCTCDTEESP